MEDVHAAYKTVESVIKEGTYDHAEGLVIDPVLDYGTYLLSSDSYVTGIAADASGNTYVLTEEGSNASAVYPGFTVIKFDPNGNLLLSGTVTSASGSDTVPTAIAVGSTGSVYVAGYAASGLPTTANAYQAANLNSNPNYYFNAFIAVLQPNGSTTAPALVPTYISYLGGTAGQTGSGNDFTYGVAVDPQGDAYIAGVTGGEAFPTTADAYRSAYPSGATSAGFVAKFNPSKSGAASLVYSTLLGGTSDYEYGIAADSAGNAYVTGTENSGTIPLTAGAFAYTGYGTGASINVTKINPTGTALVYSASLGPGAASAIAVDGKGDANVTGNTTAEDFPTTPGAYQTDYPGAFASKLNAGGTALVYSTFLSGPSGATNYSTVNPLSIALRPGCASACNTYIAGITSSSDLPLSNAVQGFQGANPTGFVVELAGTGASAVYSTYLGGITATTQRGPIYYRSYSAFTPAIATDSAGNAYITGNLSGAMDFPVTPNPVEPSGTLENTYLAKIGPGAGGNLVAAPTSVTFSSGIVNVPSTTYPGGAQPTVTLLIVTPTSVTFPAMPIGLTSATQQITLQNPGNTPVTMNSATATGDFSETNYNCPGFPFTLTPGGTCSVSVAFTPTSATNPRTGTLTVASSAGNQTVFLSGAGQVATQTIGFTPTAVSFGSIPVGTASHAQYVIVRNTGTEAVTFSASVRVSGDYAISYDPCTYAGATLAAGDDCAIQVTLTPTATGTRTGTLTLADSAGTGTQTVSLTGTGIGTSTTVAINAEARSFGEQAVGTSSGIAQLLVRNYGSSQAVTIASLSITAGSQNFVLAQGYDECTGTAVQPGGYCYVYVLFAPTVAGYDTGTVTFVDSKGTKYTSALAGYSPAATNSASL